jgi:hypothetical protein
MRIYSGVIALLLMVCAGAASAGDDQRDQSAQALLEKGLAAYRHGQFSVAVPALKEAVASGGETTSFFAEFYLARIYADSLSNVADPSKAFVLFRKIADENADIDPDDQRAPFVAKALIALAGYTRRGLPDINVPANQRRAANYLHHAAIFFNDKEAQFELARLYLSGDGGNDDVRRGLHYLSSLSEQSYPAAQALLAELFWKGRYVNPDERRALALVTMAVENAPPHDRIWIEETYHTIFCAATQGTRQEADGIMARWRRVFARPLAEPNRVGLSGGDVLPERQCANGEPVTIRRAGGAAPAGGPPGSTASVPMPPQAPEVVQGSTMSFGFRAAGAPAPAATTK